MTAPPAIPPLSNLTFRYFRDDADISGMLAVHDGCRERDRIDPFSVCYRIPNLSPAEYAADVAASLADGSGVNVLIAESRGKIVAHSRLEWWNEWDAQGRERKAYLIRGWVLPEWRGQGVGTALLNWGESRAQEMDGDALIPGELAANATDGEADGICLLTENGYSLRFLSPELARDLSDLPAASAPDGFAIRPLQTDDAREIAHALIEANADPDWPAVRLTAWIQQEEAGWVDFVSQCEPTLSRIGWKDGVVAGLHLCRRIGGVGDVANVAVRPEYRRQGLARALMFSCLQAMRNAGLQGARLYTSIGTKRDAPLVGPFAMYQGFGFRLTAFHNRYRKPLTKG